MKSKPKKKATKAKRSVKPVSYVDYMTDYRLSELEEKMERLMNIKISDLARFVRAL